MRMILDTMVKGKWKDPAGDLLGFKLVEYDSGRAVFKMKADKKHHNPMGGVHGGIMSAITDAAMGIAMVTTLSENENFSMTNFQINFLKGIIEADLTAVGIVVKRGKSVGYVESKLTDGQDNLVATAQAACMILRDTALDQFNKSDEQARNWSEDYYQKSQ